MVKKKQKAHKTDYTPHVQQDIKAGADIHMLQQKYAPKILKRAFAHCAHHTPELLNQCLGAPPLDRRILIDENLDPDLVRYIHQNFAYVDTVQYAFKKGIQDTDLYPLATQNGFDAILTNDGHCKGKKDLTGVAQDALNQYETAPSMQKHAGLILVNQRTEEALKQLSDNSRKIRSFLSENQARILSLF